MRLPMIVLVLLVLLSGCSSGPQEAAPATAAPTAAPSGAAGPSPSPEPDDVAQVSAEQCAPGPGRTVTEHDDVVIDELVVDDLVIDAVELADEVVPELVVPGFVLPRQVADGGCTVVHDAPAGCLPAVEISSARMPGLTVPDRVVPDRVLPDGTTIPGAVLRGGREPERVLEPQRAEQQCQSERAGSAIVGTVVRGALVRSTIVRATVVQGTHVSPRTCTDDGDCAPSFVVASTVVPSVVLPSTVAPSDVLAGRLLEQAPDVEVLAGETTTAFVTPGDVLFDTGSSTLRPAGEANVEAIAAQVLALPGNAPVRVDGHTDSVGADADNQGLSERRAAAVAERLVAAGVPRSRLTTRGYGETQPAAEEVDDAGRQANRRVVVGVASA